MKKPAKIRAEFRLPSDLMRWAKRYAAAQHTTVTQLVVQGLKKVKGKSNAR